MGENLPFLSLETDTEYINLQIEMLKMQKWVQKKGKRIIIIFEGRDTAGKGGAIMRFMRFLNPRACRVVALPKPTKTEKGQWYFQRYIQQFPNPGEFVLFDRSWYNRAVVEPVMGFCTQSQYKDFMRQVVNLENMLIDDGISIIKLWFSIDMDVQKKRLEERKNDPLKQWKLSSVDTLAQLKWEEYTKYKEEMFKQTGTSKCPWVIINSNNKDIARKEAMRYVLHKHKYPGKGETGVDLVPSKTIITFNE